MYDYLLLLFGVGFLTATCFLNKKWLPSLLALASFLAYFFLTQTSYWNAILFLLGVLLLVIELYIPDFGLVGILGMASLVLGLYQDLGNLSHTILLLLALMMVVVIVAYVLLKMGYSLNLNPALVLRNALNEEAGYQSHSNYNFLIGEVGQALTDLRPVGRGSIQDELYEVSSLEAFIPRGSLIKVIKVEKGTIYVRSQSNE